MGTDYLIEGLAVPWDSLSCRLAQEGMTFRERICKGAFTDFLASGKDLECWLDHNMTKRVAKRSDGTFAVIEAHDGLRVRIDPALSPWAAVVCAGIERGELRGLSVSMWFPAGGYTMVSDPTYGAVRLIRRALLAEVSIVDRPAYAATALRLVPAPPKRLRELQREVNRGDFEGDTSREHYQRATSLDMALLEFEGIDTRAPSPPLGWAGARTSVKAAARTRSAAFPQRFEPGPR